MTITQLAALDNNVFSSLLVFEIQKYSFIFFDQKISFENLIFVNYLYCFMSIYVNQLT